VWEGGYWKDETIHCGPKIRTVGEVNVASAKPKENGEEASQTQKRRRMRPMPRLFAQDEKSLGNGVTEKEAYIRWEAAKSKYLSSSKVKQKDLSEWGGGRTERG